MTMEIKVVDGKVIYDHGPLSEQKKEYLAARKRALEAVARVPEALETLPNEVEYATLYTFDAYVQDNCLEFRIDIPWDMAILEKLALDLQSHWRPDIEDWWGVNQYTEDFYVKFLFEDTPIRLCVCLKSKDVLGKEDVLLEGVEQHKRITETMLRCQKLFKEQFGLAAEAGPF